MASTRAYILAKELGVKSAAIVKKCQDEGLDVKNHMSVISAGLAATIREWFSEGENTTTIETASKVDLKKVRIKKKKVAKKASETPEGAADEAVAVMTPETSETIEKPAAAVVQETESTAVEEPEIAQPQAPTETPEKAKKTQINEPQKPAGPQIIEPEPLPQPEPVIPAGPMLEKPEPAKLSGPNVVRVEAPEPVHEDRPRHKTRPRKRYDQPVTQPLIAGKDDTKSTKKEARGSRERTHGRRKGDLDVETTKRPKFAGTRRQRDLEERKARLDAAGGRGQRLRPLRKVASRSAAAAATQRPEKATVSEPIIVKDLSAALAVKTVDIIKKLMEHGTMANANQAIAPEVAEIIALEFGTELIVERKITIEKQIEAEFDERPKKHLKQRSVVATMLGHVDHGKTSLLDKIRSSKVATGEAGGITQHIGAYQVRHGGAKVTFLDTPGHAAFTAMRARGANMTDVVVLVVAVDDGVMPQTVEVINHAKAADVPVIIALNKIDLPGCDINRIYAQLSEHDLTPTEWGGNTEVVKTSAITGEGIDDLLEHLHYIAELLELKADDTIPATGWVVEAKLSPQKGPVATLLVKEGQFKKGDIIFSGSSYGRVKALKDSFGKTIKKASSSMPVEITGLNSVPQAGDRFYCLDDINRAKNAAEENMTLSRESALAQRTQVTLENLFSQIEAGSVKELNLIIRADVQGSVDVLKKYLSELSTEEVKIKILHAATGGVTEGDVVLAEASNAIIIGFNVVAEEHVSRIAESKGIDIRFYNIIYRITEDLEKSMEGMLEPEEQEKSVGRAVVRNTFKISKIGTIAGCYVKEGVVTNKAKLRLIRDNVVVRDNLEIGTLKHFKDDVREVKTGLECGIKVNRFDDIKVDDVFDFYEIVKVARTLK